MSPEMTSGKASEPGGVFYEDGSLNEVFLSAHYGLGLEEAEQEIQFGTYQGTVAQMIADERCPMGGQMRAAYQEKGIDGVVEVLDGISRLDPNFSVYISEATIENEREKTAAAATSPEPVEKSPEDPPETPPDAPAAGSTPPRHSSSVFRSKEEERAVLETAAQAETGLTEEPGIKAASGELPPTDEGVHEPPQPIVTMPEITVSLALTETALTKTTRGNDKDVSIPDPQPERPGPMPVPVGLLSEPPPVVSETAQTALPAVLNGRDPVRGSQENVVLPVLEASDDSDKIPVLATTDKSLPHIVTESRTGREESVVTDKPDVVSESARSEVTLAAAPKELAYKLETAENLPGVDDGPIVQVIEALRSPEAAVSEPVQIAVSEVVALTLQLCEIRETGMDAAETEELLEEACVRLLEALEIPCDDEAIEKFAMLILAIYGPAETYRADTGKSPRELLRKGTHEYKLPQLNVPLLLLQAGQSLLSFQRLGRWVVTRASVA